MVIVPPRRFAHKAKLLHFELSVKAFKLKIIDITFHQNLACLISSKELGKGLNM